MGILKFLGKMFREEKTEEPTKTKISFSEIKNWIEKREQEEETKEKDVLSEIKLMIENLIKELQEKIIPLKNFDVEEKKETDQIKGIVINARKKYIESLEELISKLKNLEETKLENCIKKINRIYSDFGKNSFKNYERATILIGKEMGEIKKSLGIFSQDLLNKFEENKYLIGSFKSLSEIRENLNQINETDKDLKEIEKERMDLNKEVENKKKEKIDLEKNLDKVKNSEDFLKNIEAQKKVELSKKELKEEILKLNSLIDFKSLADFFHIFPKQMKLVKEYKENFSENLEKYGSKEISNLLNQANLNNETIQNKMSEIKTKKDEIEILEGNIKEDKSKKMGYEIEEFEKELKNLESDKLKEDKREERLKSQKEDLIKELKEKLHKEDIELEN